MRIHRVSMTGFGPFRTTQSVDFDALGGDGLFLIHGRTGSGKTTILDAVVYALYGTAPRYSTLPGSQIRSQHCTPRERTLVEVEFTVGDERHRVRRSPEYERPKSRGEGMTPEKATAELARWDGDQWEGLASQVRTVGQWLHDLVPFSAEQFLQVVLLAQGDFQRFLVAPSKDRQALLRTLFDSRRFDQYDAELQRRAGELRQRLRSADEAAGAALESLADHVGHDLPEAPDEAWVAGLVRVAVAEEAEAVATATATGAALESARATYDALLAVRRHQTRRRELEATRARLEAEAQVEHSERTALAAALAARSVQPAHAALVDGERTLVVATEARDKAAARYVEVAGQEPPACLATERDALRDALASLADALRAERSLSDARRTQAQGAADAEQAREQAEALSARRASLVEQVEADPEHDLEQRLAAASRLREEHDASVRHAAAVADLEAALAAAYEAGLARTRASEALDVLRRRRLDEYAGTLASGLVQGEPCRVCGATAHPSPAPAPTQPVTDEVLEDAQAALDAATRRAGEADGRVAAARALTDQHAGSRPVTAVSDDLDQALVLLDAARAEEQARQRDQRALLEVSARHEEVQVRLATLRAGAEHLATQVRDLEAVVAAGRGDAESVAERESDLRRHLDVVQGLAAAQADASTAADAAGTAQVALARTLEHHGFTSLDEAVAARRSPQLVEDLQARVRRRSEEWTRVRAGLDEPDLQDLPDEPVDPTLAHAAVEMARAEHDRAAGARGAAEQRSATTAALAAQVRRAWERSADDRTAHALVQRLANSVHGEQPNTRRLRLENYVLAVELEQILHAANQRLAVMSTGRYELQVSEEVATRGNSAGLDVRVLDQHTGEGRSPESLSGGERFLASLALALGMAEVVQHRAGGVNLDTLFIDEGFGSLDAETLDLVMHTLDELRANGRVVGIISHVEGLKERIGTQVVVEPAAGGWSEVRVLG